MRPQIIPLIFALIASASFAAAPDDKIQWNPSLQPEITKTESHWQAVYPYYPPPHILAASTPDLYKLSDFNINYHPPVTVNPPITKFQGTLLLKQSPPSQNQIETWKSFTTNGHPAFLRPAIFNQTPTLIKDSTTGQTFTSSDPVHILGIETRPANSNLNLIDDRPKQK